MECLTAIILVAAVAALVLAAIAHRRVRAAERAITDLESALRKLTARSASTAPPLSGAAPVTLPASRPPSLPAAPDLTASLPAAAPLTSPLAAAAPAEAAVHEPAEPLAPDAPAEAPPRPAVPPVPPGVPKPPKPPEPPRISLEERLGARLPVWIGSIALALAGAFLVKYSFDQGWLSPAVRVTLGVAFGVVMLGAGEAMRRSSPRVSQGLSAAGIADLFACFLAGTTLYGLISPAAGFGLIVLTAAVAVALSLRQGPMVALIGLLGGFVAPYMIHSGQPSARNLFGYLLVLEIGFLFAARRRGWLAIGGLANAGGLLWAAAWLAGPFTPPDAVWISLFLVLLAAATTIAALAGRRQAWGDEGLAAWLARGTLGLGLATVAMVAGRAGYSTLEWWFFGILAAGVLALGLFDAELAGLSWMAAAIAAALLFTWGPGGGHALAEPGRYRWTALGLGLLFAAAGLAGARLKPWRGRPRPGRWAALAAAAGVVFFLLAYTATREQPVGISWGIQALALGLLYIAAAYLFARGGEGAAAAAIEDGTPPAPEAVETASRRATLAAIAVAATTFVSLAVPLELDRSWFAVAWALEVPALLWLAGRFRLPVLTWLARGLAALVLVRLFNPAVIDVPVGHLPLLNWLLYGYGAPLAAFAAGAELARRQADRRTGAGLEGAAVAIAWALLTLEIRQWFHPGDLGNLTAYLAELGTVAVAWFLLACAAFALGRRLGRRSLRLSGVVAAWAALVLCVLGPGLAANPLWNHRPVGETLIVNLLLWAFGAPIAALALTAGILRPRELPAAGEAPAPGEPPSEPSIEPSVEQNIEPTIETGTDRLARRSAGAFALAALAGLFVLISLEVRQAFHGSYLDTGAATVAERYAYSAAWILFATLLLVLGIRARHGRSGRTLRYASLAVMMLAVAKVFLYDMSSLGDLYRVFSFLGLGASLLLLAFLYQRFVFREAR